MGHTIAQPEFSVGIVAPTVGNPIGCKGTGVTCTGIDIDQDSSTRRQHQHWDEAINDGSVTNLADILPPTVRDTTACQCTGMTPACTNGVKRDIRGHCH
jgi:hypothetical protein